MIIKNKLSGKKSMENTHMSHGIFYVDHIKHIVYFMLIIIMSLILVLFTIIFLIVIILK